MSRIYCQPHSGPTDHARTLFVFRSTGHTAPSTKPNHTHKRTHTLALGRFVSPWCVSVSRTAGSTRQACSSSHGRTRDTANVPLTRTPRNLNLPSYTHTHTHTRTHTKTSLCFPVARVQPSASSKSKSNMVVYCYYYYYCYDDDYFTV